MWALVDGERWFPFIVHKLMLLRGGPPFIMHKLMLLKGGPLILLHKLMLLMYSIS